MMLGIIGMGTVGRAIAHVYRGYHELYCYDTNKAVSPNTFDEVSACELKIICVPEYAVEVVVDQLPPSNICIKSSVAIGTTKYLQDKHRLHNIVHSPEFLTQRTAYIDALIPRSIIIGHPITQHIIQKHSYFALVSNRFPGCVISGMGSNESEAVKLMTNAFFAAKIALMNEFHTFCDHKHIHWSSVLHGMLSDGRICPEHTQVPGPDGHYGFGGKCLPKDLSNLIGCMLRSGCDPFILQTVFMRNENDRKKSGGREV